jgi:threonine/homoserine/homoserine lactone efflux protein
MNWSGFYGLAVFAAVYPLVLAVVALLLPRPRPAVLLAGMLTGGFLTTLISGVVIVFVVGSTDALGGSNGHVVRAWVNIVIGAVLVIATVRILRGPAKRHLIPWRHKNTSQQPQKEKQGGWSARAAKANSFWTALVIGVVIDLPSVWYLAALKYVIDANYPGAVEFLLIVSYALVAYIFVELPLIFNVRWPKQTQHVVQSANSWVKTHQRPISAGVAGFIGIWQLSVGIGKLA